MSDKMRLGTIDIRFGEKYDPRQMRLLQQQILAITSLNQKFVQLLRGGSVGQVLKKTGPGDLEATWVDP